MIFGSPNYFVKHNFCSCSVSWPIVILNRAYGIQLFHNISSFRSNRIKTIRLPLFVGLCMMFIGNALYICLELGLPIQRRYLLLLGRFITGMGSGNVSLLRTYASTASTSKDRPRAIAFVTCGQALVCFPWKFRLQILNLCFRVWLAGQVSIST